MNNERMQISINGRQISVGGMFQVGMSELAEAAAPDVMLTDTNSLAECFLCRDAETVQRAMDKLQELVAAGATSLDYVSLYREIRFERGDGDAVFVNVQPCAKKRIVFMATGTIYYEVGTALYGIVCYLMDIPGGASVGGEEVVLNHHIERIFLEGATVE